MDGLDGVGDDHERCMLGLGDNVARPWNELPEEDGDSSSHCFWIDVDGGDALEEFSSKAPCSLFMGTMSRNHSSSS